MTQEQFYYFSTINFALVFIITLLSLIVNCVNSRKIKKLDYKNQLMQFCNQQILALLSEVMRFIESDNDLLTSFVTEISQNKVHAVNEMENTYSDIMTKCDLLYVLITQKVGKRAPELNVQKVKEYITSSHILRKRILSFEWNSTKDTTLQIAENKELAKNYRSYTDLISKKPEIKKLLINISESALSGK